jgi:hypothetical protein
LERVEYTIRRDKGQGRGEENVHVAWTRKGARGVDGRWMVDGGAEMDKDGRCDASGNGFGTVRWYAGLGPNGKEVIRMLLDVNSPKVEVKTRHDYALAVKRPG